MPVRARVWCAVSVMAAGLALASSARAQEPLPVHRITINGRVTADSGKSVAGAEVIVTMAPDRAFLRATTDTAGMYTIVFERGTSDFLVHATAVGMDAYRRRVTGAPNDSVFSVVIPLTRTRAQELEAVHVSARKPRLRRDVDGTARDAAGSAESEGAALTGAIEPNLRGDLAAIAGTVPGVAVTPNGVSVAGVAPSQNSTTLNGMAFAGASVPRDTRTSVRVTTSTYDPSRGWFGGLQEDVRLTSGIVVDMRSAHVTFDTPALQYNDPISATLGQRFTNVQFGIGEQGRTYFNRLDYNYGVQGGRRTADVASLTSAPAAVLARAGIAPDSVARVLAALATAGVPGGTSHRPPQQVMQTASFLGQIGSAPDSWTTMQPVKTTWQLLGYALTQRVSAAGTSPLAMPDFSGTTDQLQLASQARLSTFVHDDYLVEAKSALSIANTDATPTLRIPAGRVLLASDVVGAPAAITAVAFGGSDALPSKQRRWTWETTAQAMRIVPGRPTHRVKLDADSRIDGVAEHSDANARGAFTFATLGDVAANRPTSFTRTLTAPTEHGTEWNGFVALSDWWRKSDDLRVLYGARIEANRFLGAPANNPAVASAFGVRTDRLPNTIGVSPRLGFTWVRRANDVGALWQPLGRFTGAPLAYISGGIGEFRGFLSPELAARSSALTGLPSGTRSLTCLGDATPTPAWSQYLDNPGAIPDRCSGSTAASAFDDGAPNVRVFDRDYTAPRSWRANVAYASTFGRFTYTVNALYSLNLNQPGQVDLNFAGTPRFVTSDEQRPVFVLPSSIVGSSGLVATSDARTDVSFGHVFENISTLRSVTRQATLTISPDLGSLTNWFASASYTLGRTRALASGFDGATFESPGTRGWSRGDYDVRNQVVLQGGVTKRAVTLTLFGRIQSGIPYTPLVGGDVNGDGLVNDRAFVFDPATAHDTSVAQAMRTLLGAAQGNTRSCLSRQLGHPAGRNSCEGPWTAALNAQITVAATLPIVKRSANIAIAFVNPLGGIDQLLHGADHMRGWGTPGLADPVLYTVRGFDAVAERFRYSVNPRFGDTRPSATTVRAPFRVTLDVSIDLAPSTERQFLNRFVRPGRSGWPGARLSASALKHPYDVVTPDPYGAILEESDSLMLTATQMEALTLAQRAYKGGRDSVYTALATYLAGLPDDFSMAEAIRRQGDALSAAWDLGHASIKRTLPGILSPIQIRMLPYPANILYAAPDDVHGLKLVSWRP